LDARISELAFWDGPLGRSGAGSLSSPLPNDPTRAIARLSGAVAVAVIACSRDGARRPVTCYGAPFRAESLKLRMTDRDTAYSVSQALSQDEEEVFDNSILARVSYYSSDVADIQS
jgi:hypothetical protein